MSAVEYALPPSPPRPRLHPLLRSALFLLAFFAVQLGVGWILTLALPDGSGEAGPAGSLLRSNEILLFAFAAALPPLFLVTWAFLRLFDRRPLSAIGLRLPVGGWRAALRQAVAAPLGAAALLGGWLLLLLALPDGDARFTLLGVAAGLHQPPAWWTAPPLLLLALLQLGFFLQGWVEEWVFRGYLLQALKERWSPSIAAAASSLLFAWLHGQNPAVSRLSLVNIFLAGMIFAGLVERTGSLWSASLAHGAWNFAVACLLSVPVSGYSLFHLLDVRISGLGLFTGGSFGPEGSLLLTPVAALLAAWIWRGLPRRPPWPRPSGCRGPRPRRFLGPRTA